jgi:hypothetical protein
MFSPVTKCKLTYCCRRRLSQAIRKEIERFADSILLLKVAKF